MIPKKKFLSLLLASALLISGFLTACGTKTPAGESSTTKTSESGTSTEAGKAGEGNGVLTPYGAYDEPIVITTAKISDPNPRMPDGKSAEDNVLVDAVRERLNIEVKVVWQANINEYNNKLSLNIASGDIPDLTFVENKYYSTFKSLAENDMLTDLSEAFANCQGPYMKYVYDSFGENSQAATTFGGKMLGLTSGEMGYQHDLLWIREDWLNELNLELPKTMDDVLNIAQTFVDQRPGGEENLGFALHALTPVGKGDTQYGMDPIFSMNNAFPKRWMTDEAGKVYWGSVAPEMKDSLAIVQKMYADGLIDKSFMTRTQPGETNAVVTGGLSGIYFAPWWDVYSTTTDLTANNIDARMVAVQAPLNSDGKYVNTTPSPASHFLTVRKGYEHPEAVFKMLNVIFDIWRGFDHEYDEELQKYKDLGTNWESMFPTSGLNLAAFDEVPNAGLVAKKYIDTNEIDREPSPSNPGQWITLAEQAKSFIDNPDPQKNPGGAIEYYGRYMSSNLVNTDTDLFIQPAYFFNTESASELKANLDKLEDEMFLQIIVGEKSIDYFDEFVQLWQAQGGDVLTAEVQEAVDAK